MDRKRAYKTYLERLRFGRIWPHLFVIVGGILIVTVLVVNYTLSVVSQQSMQTVRANASRIDRLDELHLLMVNAESSVRGYLLTHSDPYLDLFNKSRQRLGPLLDELEGDYPVGDPAHGNYETLRAYVVAKRDFLAGAVDVGKVVQKIEAGQSGTGKLLMDEIRAEIIILKGHRLAENARLEEEAEARLQKIQLVMYGLAVGSFALIIALFTVQQRQARLRLDMNTLLENENVRLESMVSLRTRELNDLASYLTNAREAERNRLARELHDELGSLLTAAKMDANWLLRSLGGHAEPAIKDRFLRLIDNIGTSIRVKRNITEDLRPPLLQGLGLLEALRALADSFSGDVPVTLELPDEDPGLVEAQSLALFRIAQESLTNILKYAQASQVRLGLATIENQVVVWVADDGLGFDPDKTSLKRHGLAGMKHRVLMFGGVFKLTSAPGKGTRVEARMPMQPAAAVR